MECTKDGDLPQRRAAGEQEGKIGLGEGQVVPSFKRDLITVCLT